MNHKESKRRWLVYSPAPNRFGAWEPMEVRINPSGFLRLGDEVTKLVGSKVVLMYDAVNNAIGMQPVPNDAFGGISTKTGPNANDLRGQVAVHGFINYVKLDVKKLAGRYIAHIEDGIIVIPLNQPVSETEVPNA